MRTEARAHESPAPPRLQRRRTLSSDQVAILWTDGSLVWSSPKTIHEDKTTHSPALAAVQLSGLARRLYCVYR